jgi:hypothetical protein
MRVRQSVVAAAEAPPISTQGASSVFALADKEAENMAFDSQQTPAPDAGTADELPPRERLLKTLESCGELGAPQLAEAAGINPATLSYHITPLIASGDVAKSGGGNRVKYSLARRGGFKGWLRRKGQESAEGRAPRKADVAKIMPAKSSKAPRAAKPAPVESVTNSSAAAAPLDAATDIECGLFSSGEISIAAGGQSIRISAANTRRLLAWLSKVDQVLQADGATAPGGQ